MLSKEECEKSYANLSVIREMLNINGLLTNTYDKSMVTFASLIKEHFDNPPLKFEELREGDWVWDKNWGEYFEISEVYPKTNEFDILIHQNAINKKRYETIRFEENRFYRREVKEND